jgi:hypothetical protein
MPFHPYGSTLNPFTVLIRLFYYERFVMTALEIWMTGTATHLKVHGHFLLAIMVGLYQIALQKD